MNHVQGILIVVWCFLILATGFAQAADDGTTKSFTYKKTKQGGLEIVVH